MELFVAGRGAVAVRGLRLFHTLGRLRPALALHVVAVPTRGTEPPTPELPTFRQECADNGWPVLESIDDVTLGPDDVLLSLQYDRKILPGHVGAGRALNLHFALLPRHRGSVTAYWPIVGRDPEIGVTLHEVTAGMDEGPIVATAAHPLAPFTTSGALTDLHHELGFELLVRSADTILAGDYRARPQGASPDPTHRRSDIDFTACEITGFDRPAAEVRARCLALIAPAHQLPTFEGRAVVRAYDLPGRPDGAGPGEVVDRSAGTAAVACADGVVCLEFADPAG